MTNLEQNPMTDATLLGFSVDALISSAKPGTIDRASLRKVIPGLFYAKLFVLATLLGVAVGGVIATSGLTRIVIQILLGALLAHATELIHQCLHRTATGRAARDQAFGMIIATPLGISFWRYLADHFAHHKDVTIESFSYNYQRMESPSLTTRIAGFVLHVSMVNHFVDTLKWIGYALTGRLEAKLEATRPGLNPQIVRRVKGDYLMMVALMILAVVVTITFETNLVIQLWLIPMIIGWAPIHALIELPEHWNCETSSRNARLNTRSIRASWLMRWFVNHNCNHVGHHMDLNVATERLPDYEAVLMNEEPFKYFEQSYPRFYFRFFRYLLTGAS
ncbi:MAG TPA: fatty acid desaturase [Pyrinomonadaceae bacterium]|jgi:fatty acid desaturase|nr:fatty acid desaturase [Pyrinomonadaceae bacterium]